MNTFVDPFLNNFKKYRAKYLLESGFNENGYRPLVNL